MIKGVITETMNFASLKQGLSYAAKIGRNWNLSCPVYRSCLCIFGKSYKIPREDPEADKYLRVFSGMSAIPLILRMKLLSLSSILCVNLSIGSKRVEI